MNGYLHYFLPGQLHQHRSGIVQAGYAPDGLPLLTTLDAPPKAEDLLRYAAGTLGIENPQPGYAGTPLESVVEALDRVLETQRIQRLIRSDQDSLNVMVLAPPLRRLIGPTLMERLFQATDNATLLPASVAVPTYAAPPPPGAQPATNVYASAAEESPDRPQPRFVMGEACLAFPLDNSDPVVVRRERSPSGWPEYAFRRDFAPETMAALPGSRLETWVSYRTEQIPAADTGRYRSFRRQNPDAFWKWTVPRTDAARAVLNLCHRLVGMQEQDEIHGDIKPANILLTSDGLTLIDSLGLAPGDRSPAMTQGWAAPEQILGSPVSLQTDQYAPGLMLLRLTEGVLFGEEARISVPVGKRKVEYHTLLRNPGVFIDPASAPVRPEAVDDWRDLIERCVRFAPEDRFDSMQSLADRLQSLIEQETLTGELEIYFSFGRPILAQRDMQEAEPCWLID